VSIFQASRRQARSPRSLLWLEVFGESERIFFEYRSWGNDKIAEKRIPQIIKIWGINMRPQGDSPTTFTELIA